MNNVASLGTAIHATAISIGGAGVVITGPSGSGKSDLALRLIDRGAILVSDDYVVLERKDSGPILRQAPNIAGKIEVRGVGIIEMPVIDAIPAMLHVELCGDEEIERLPSDVEQKMVGGIMLPTLRLDPFQHSAPIKVELALAHKLIG
jgi:serine kinase of HPr protein (carbohydrate metabolism regulator)